MHFSLPKCTICYQRKNKKGDKNAHLLCSYRQEEIRVILNAGAKTVRLERLELH